MGGIEAASRREQGCRRLQRSSDRLECAPVLPAAKDGLIPVQRGPTCEGRPRHSTYRWHRSCGELAIRLSSSLKISKARSFSALLADLGISRSGSVTDDGPASEGGVRTSNVGRLCPQRFSHERLTLSSSYGRSSTVSSGAEHGADVRLTNS